jgi:hypothetical protein
VVVQLDVDAKMSGQILKTKKPLLPEAKEALNSCPPLRELEG